MFLPMFVLCTHQKTDSNEHQSTPNFAGVLTLYYFKKLTVSYCTVLDEDPNHLTRTPPILLSEEYLQHNFDYPKLPGNKWKQK